MNKPLDTPTIGSADDRALDAATRGKVGTTRRGFHVLFTQYRTQAGTAHTVERCTCTESRYNHVAAAR